jgi:hypothetical protein
MGKSYDSIDANVSKFIRAQKMFFVATAPLADDGKIYRKSIDGLPGVELDRNET